MVDRRFQPKKRPSQARNHVLLLLLLVILLAGSIFMFMPPEQKITQGLDIQGGLSVVLQANKSDGVAPSSEEMQSSQQIVERRVNALGASEASVQVQGSNQLLVQMPGMVDQTQALQTIGQTGVLEFVDLSTVSDQNISQALSSGSLVSDQEVNEMLAFGSITTDQVLVSLVNGRVPAGMYTRASTSSEDSSTGGDSSSAQSTYYYPLSLEAGSYTPVFSGFDIASVTIGFANQLKTNYSVNIKLNSSATAAWAETTTKLYPTKGQVAIVLDGVIQSTPAVQSAITSGETSITGNYDLKSATALKTILESGSLPVSLQVINSQVVGPTLGQESLVRGVLVALVGLAIVALYLLAFYRGIGLLTAGAVGVFALLYLGVLATLSYFGQFALSLSGLAGIVLAIGVAADSSILVLERFKEEIRMGRSVRASSITGVHHAIITSIDADLVTLVSALALFFIGIGSVQGFGLTLALGVICDIATMLLFKAPVLRLLAPRVISKHPGFWGVKEDEELALEAGELNRGATHG